EWVPVYNLQIADYHTYFVGCDDWSFSVWAHNLCWYHGTDSSETVSKIGLNKAAFLAENPAEPDKGFFVTPFIASAKRDAITKALGASRGGVVRTPVVLEANGAVIGPFLKPTNFTNDPTTPEWGEMYIPVEDFDKVPRNAFRRRP